MTRKESLKQIAQRCMEGESSYRDYFEDRKRLSDFFDLLGHMLTVGCISTLSLDKIAKLEAELLPNGYEVQVFVDKVAVCKIYKKEVIDLVLNRMLVAMADADNEPLARLAALCLALAEMENDT